MARVVKVVPLILMTKLILNMRHETDILIADNRFDEFSLFKDDDDMCA